VLRFYRDRRERFQVSSFRFQVEKKGEGMEERGRGVSGFWFLVVKKGKGMKEIGSRMEGTRKAGGAAEPGSCNLKLETRNQKLFLFSASAPASGRVGQCVLKLRTRRYEGADTAALKAGCGGTEGRTRKRPRVLDVRT
jgi:hypothetical protein